MTKLMRVLLGFCGAVGILLCLGFIMILWEEIQFPKHVEDLRMQAIQLLGTLKVGQPVYRFTLPEDFNFRFIFHRPRLELREGRLSVSYYSRRKTMEVSGSRRITQEIRASDIASWFKNNFELIKDYNKVIIQLESWRQGSFYWGAMTLYYSPDGIITSVGDLKFYGRTRFLD